MVRANSAKTKAVPFLKMSFLEEVDTVILVIALTTAHRQDFICTIYHKYDIFDIFPK
jgi:hypothetical protein